MSYERFDSFVDATSTSTHHRRPSMRGPGLSTDGLPRMRMRKSSDGLSPRWHHSSGSVPQIPSPVTPSDFPHRVSRRGTLRVPGGIAPVMPGDGRSPFRFLPTNEDPPLTPMDISPVTPRTPRFLLPDVEPDIATSSPLSPDYLSIDFQIHSGIPKEQIPTRPRLHNRNPSEPIPSIYISSNPSPPPLEHSTQYQSYETPLAEEEYAAAYAVHFRSQAPAAYLYEASREERGRSKDLNRTLKRLSTRSLSPPRQRHISPIERPYMTTAVTEPQKHVDPSVSRSPNASRVGSPVDRANAFDFAAAREGLKRQGEVDVPSSSSMASPQHKRGPSSSSDKHYPTPKAILSEAAAPRAAPVVNAKITPTRRPPALLRLGNKLKSEVKGAFARTINSPEPGSESNKDTRIRITSPRMRVSSPRMKTPRPQIEKVEAVHWTELDY